MSLRNTQELFKDTMLSQPVAVENPAQELHNMFAEGKIPLSDRLKVYRNNIVGGITDNVKTAFPILNALVGEAFLELMIRSYLLEYPPENGCLNTYGEDLPDYIDHFEAAKAMPYLSDIARFEAAQNNAYYAPDDSAMSAQDLGEIPTDALEGTLLKLRSSAHLIYSRFPLLKIKGFCEKQNRAEDENLDITSGKTYVLIIRPELDTKIIELPADEWTFLKFLQDGQPLGQAVEKTLEKHPNFDINETLQKHITLETFARS
ncbi:MAG: DNA-binding domain-containing protein [Pseudomonadota bacterium]